MDPKRATRPSISVIVPVYNSEATLPELATAKDPNLPEEAQQHFEKQLQERLAPLGYKVRVEYEQGELR